MKREFKGFVCGVIVTALVAGGAAFAAGQWKTIDVLENDITVLVDGKQVTEDNFVYNDRTYLPLRAVAEVVGKPVDYDEATNTAYIGSKPQTGQDISAIISAPLDTAQEVADLYSPSLDFYAKGNFCAREDSAHGISLDWCATNVSDKEIKYIDVVVRLYNAVGDLITDDLGYNQFVVGLVGPVEPGESFRLATDPFAYTSVCNELNIDEIRIEFMDGSIVEGFYGYSTTWIRKN